MEVAINICHGMFALSRKASEKLEHNIFYYSRPKDKNIRTDKKLINTIKTLGEKESSHPWLSRLKIVEIPDNITDWKIIDHDGFEDILYVIDGKMYWEDGED